jgi:DNA-directed RNA polymerase specialized sigma24 family protein
VPAPADLIRQRARFDLKEIEWATAFLRGGRIAHPLRSRPGSRQSEDDWRVINEQEAELRRELVRMSEDWRVLDRLTPRQMTVLLAIATEGSGEKAARRLCISTQTIKNHLTAARRAVYGEQYYHDLGKTANSPLIAMAVRWAMDYEERLTEVAT